MLTILLLTGQIVSAYPPLPPARAAAILAASQGLSNRTYAIEWPPGPLVVILGSSPTAGPFGEFAPLPWTWPLGANWCCGEYWPVGYSGRLMRSRHVVHAIAQSRTRVVNAGRAPRSGARSR